MKKKILIGLLCILPITAATAMPYVVEQRGTIASESDGDGRNDAESLARNRRFYIGGAYNFSMWNDGADDAVKVSGKNNSSFDISAGIRVYDTFRLEANYYRLSADWDAFDLTGNTVMINAIFDARIDSLYRIFRNQKLVPYVGFGAGVSWNSADGAHIDDEMSAVAAGLVGFGIEFNEWFALDFGYKYMYMFTPKFDVISDFAPTTHQFRAGARIHF